MRSWESFSRLIGWLLIAHSAAVASPLGEESQRVKREVLVLFGNDTRESPDDMGWPRDTEAAAKLQTPLEWMGYELHYWNLLKEGEIGREALARYGGLIVDGSLHVPEAVERMAVGAIEGAKAMDIPVVFVGTFPFSSRVILRDVMHLMRMRGDGSVLRRPQTTGIVSIDAEMMNHEAEVRPRNAPTLRLQAPEGANVFLSVAARESSGEVARFDPVFLCDWGGAMLDPYLEFQPSAKQTLLFVDIYEFLDRVWPAGLFPAPDPTTRDGMRVFFSHIDGDGFASLSNLRSGAICGEIILEKILQKYPLPVTVSVVEANIRGLEETQNPGFSPRLEQVAREVFALPHVEAATHTFSHPFVWIDGDLPYEEQYESRNLKLNSSVSYSEIDLDREIGGSAAYVRTLLPEGKDVELVLWSGNCQPGLEALRVAEKFQMENMNGGDTVISRRYRGIAGIAPRVMRWGDQIQILAPNQNDFVYTRDWSGTSRTGFAEVIETFEITESPRRLKPVNVYYHFYSGAFMGPLSSLARVHSWCVEQQLHPVTALQFAKITRDSHSTQIFREGELRWRLVNSGQLRTYRLPSSAGVPSMDSSSGVTGFHTEADWRYIHTDGRKEVLLELTDAPPRGYLYLERSNTEIEFEILSATTAQFTQLGLRSIETVFGGAIPGREYTLDVNGSRSTVFASTDGRIHLSLPPKSRVFMESAQ